jgi:hypothetical protein
MVPVVGFGLATVSAIDCCDKRWMQWDVEKVQKNGGI